MTCILTDSKAAMDIIKGEVIKKQSKHMATKINVVREAQNKRYAKVLKTDGADNLTDICTKPKTGSSYKSFRKLIRNVHILGRPVVRFGQKIKLSKLFRRSTKDEETGMDTSQALDTKCRRFEL